MKVNMQFEEIEHFYRYRLFVFMHFKCKMLNFCSILAELQLCVLFFQQLNFFEPEYSSQLLINFEISWQLFKYSINHN